MAIDTFSCPECQVKLRRSPQLQEGARVRCPKCSFEFTVPGSEAEAPPPEEHEESAPPDDSPKRGRAATTPRDDFDREEDRDEREDRIGKSPRRRDDRYGDDRPRRRDVDAEDDDYPSPRRIRVGSPSDLSSDYQIDLGQWFAHAKEHWGEIVGPAIGFLLLWVVIHVALSLVPFIGGLLSALMDIPLGAGLPIVCLLQLKGKRWSFGDFFGGFQIFGQVLAVGLLEGLIVLAAMLPGIILGIIVIVVMAQAVPARGGGPGPEAILAASPFFLASLVAGIYLQIRTGFYALYLIIDRDFGVIEAIAGSWKLTKGHTLMLFAVLLVTGLIQMGGFALCGIGVLLAIPFTSLVVTAGYLLVAGSQPPVSRGEGSDRPDRPRSRDDEDDRRIRRPRDEDEDF